MRRLVWTPEAREDYAEVLSYATERDPYFATLLENRILSAIDLLATRPIGRRSRLADLSQKLVLKTSYIVAYRTNDIELTVMRIIHQSRDWPVGGWPED